MRKMLPEDKKRNKIIGIKTTEEVKRKLQFISDREDRPMSSQLNLVLENYIAEYFTKNKINWEEYEDYELK